MPRLPEPDDEGRYLAVEYSRVSLARDLIRERKALALSQTQLASLPGVRQETVSRIETGRHSVTIKTYDKSFMALEKARKERSKLRQA